MSDEQKPQAAATPPARKKNVLDDRKLDLRAPNNDGKNALLKWGMFGNYPSISVFTNDPNDTKDNGRISANFDQRTFFAFIALIGHAVEKTGPFLKENKVFVENFKGHPKELEKVSKAVVGRNDDGTVWIGVFAESRPSIQFPFGEDIYHHFHHADGSAFSQAEFSQLYASAYVALLSPIVTHLMVANYEHREPEPRENKGGFNRGGGGGFNRGGGGGGYQRNGGGGGYNRGNYGGGGGNRGGGGYNNNRGGQGGGGYNNGNSGGNEQPAAKADAVSFPEEAGW